MKKTRYALMKAWAGCGWLAAGCLAVGGLTGCLRNGEGKPAAPARLAAAEVAAPATGVTGRYVRIELSGNYLQMAEVEVLSGGENVALNKPATMSSCPYGEAVAGAGKGVDGNADPQWRRDPSNSIFCTGNNGLEWWEVDLGAERKIESLRLTQRADKHALDRLVGARVQVLDGRREPVCTVRIETVAPVYELKLPPPDFFAEYGAGAPQVKARAAVDKNIVLVAENQPRAVIVLAADADVETKSAALFLRASVAAATGAELPIIAAGAYRKEQTGIFVGAEAVRRLGRAPLAETSWGYQETGGDLYLMGGGPRCLTVAVRHFLEDAAGMRWWFEDEKLIPTQAGLSVPAGSARSAETAFVRTAVNNNASLHGIAADSYTSFCRYAAHGTLRFAPLAKHFAAHPEWYAEKDGKRNAAAKDFCMTSPDMAGLVDEYAGNMLAEIRRLRSSDVRLFGMGREDNAEWCQCATCRAAYKAGSHSDVYMAFVNRVAERVEREFPDVLIVYSAYQAGAALPKKEMPRRNILVWFCTEAMDYSKSIYHPANKGTREVIEGWRSVAAHMGIWHYLRGFERYRGRYDGAGFASFGVFGPDWPVVNLRVFPEFVTFLRENGVKYFFGESEDSFLHRDAAVMKHWILNQFLEDPALKYEDALRTFTDGYYGAAGAKVREYLARLEAAQEKNPPKMWFFADLMAARHLTLDACLDADARLAEAEAAVSAPADKDSLDRVRFLRACTMDRLFIVKWPAFRREWRLAGSGKEFPVRPDDLATRASAAGEWYGRVVKDEKKYADLTAKWSAFARRRFADDVALPVPQELADTPAAKVFQVPAQSYSFDLTGAAAARLNADFNLAAENAATGALVESTAAPGGYVLSFADPSAELKWTKIRTWGGRDEASTARQDLAAESGSDFRLLRLGVYDFDTVNSGLAFELGGRKWNFYPLDLEPGSYEVWLNARYDAAKRTLFIERLVARKQP